MKKISLLFLVSTVGLIANTQALHVNLDIYANKSFLNKTFELTQTGEINIKVPTYINLQDIRYKIDKQCQVDKSLLSNVKKEIDPNMENLREQRAKKVLEIKVLKAKGSLFKTLSLEKVEDMSKIDKISLYLSKNLIENLTHIANLQKEIIKIDKKLKETNSINEEYKILKTVYTCNSTQKELKISYPQEGIKYTPYYNISANINNKSVTIEKKATLFYRGVENYENIDLNIYSYRYNQNVAPQYFYPEYLGQKREVLYAQKAMAMKMDTMKESAMNSPIVQHEELATKSVYKIKEAKLKSGEKNLLHVDKEIVDASFKTTIDAYGSNKAYLEAIFKSKKEYSEAYANFFLNQNPIASRYMEKIQKNRETKLYFGEDEHIQIKKELIKTLDEKTFFGDKKISTQNWEYTITNTKPYNTKIEFITRVPVSKDGDIKVKTLAQPKFDSQNAEGKTIWKFNLNPKTNKKIIFGFEVSNSK